MGIKLINGKATLSSYAVINTKATNNRSIEINHSDSDVNLRFTEAQVRAPADRAPLFPEHIRTHSSLDKAQSETARRVVKDVERDLDFLESEVKHALEYFESVRALHTQLADYHRTAASLLAPARTLPTEILEKIFVHCADPSTILEPWRPGVWTLRKVCSRWRYIVDSTPQLWSSIQVGSMSSSRDRLGVVPKILPFILRRSGQHPLDVTLANDEDRSIVFTLLVTHAARWRELRLVRPLLQHLPKDGYPFPSLETLHFGDSFGYMIQTHNHFRDAPVLREVHGRRLLVLGTPSKLPYGQLTILSGLFLSHMEACFVLKQATSLVELKIDLQYTEYDEISEIHGHISSHPHITLPHLRTLEITTRGGGAVLECLVSPSLLRLHLIERRDTHAMIIFKHLSTFLARSKCKLENVRLHLSELSCLHYGSAGWLILLLKSMSSVRHLQVETRGQFPPFDSLLDAAKVQPDTPTMLPNLQTLFIFHPFYPVDIDHLLDFLKPRCVESLDASQSSVSSLKSLEIDGHYLGVDHTECLKRMKTQYQLMFAENQATSSFSVRFVLHGRENHPTSTITHSSL
ncbi:hypothetical protein HGRIS_003105 [Hohenbuehelia grisea]|uniref:F-box domain-containing protein n=1 Tax=Hohenbuehelia grisea TaxID=104357 RepID=A0ABR3JMG8_9AGAR